MRVATSRPLWLFTLVVGGGTAALQLRLFNSTSRRSPQEQYRTDAQYKARFLVEEDFRQERQPLNSPNFQKDVTDWLPYLPKTFPIALPELACVYLTTVLPNLTSWNHVKLTNPAGRRGGHVEVYITLDGKVPNLPRENQLAVLGKNVDAKDRAACDTSVKGGCAVVLIFRLFHVRDGYEPFDLATYEDPTVVWGNVAPAKLFYGNQSAGWMELFPCGRPAMNFTTQMFAEEARRRLTSFRYNLPRHEALKNVNGNAFVLPVDDNQGLFSNADSNYMFAGSYYEAKPEGPVYLLGHITGRMPFTPTVDMAGGKPTLDSVADIDIENFYTINGALSWTGRNYSIITGPSKDIAEKCGLFQASRSLFLSTATPAYLQNEVPTGDLILPLPTYVAYVVRYMLASRNHTDAYIDAASDAKSVEWTRNACVAADEHIQGKEEHVHLTCYDPDWVAGKMKENVATIQYYLCDISAPESQRLTPFGRTLNKRRKDWIEGEVEGGKG
ncbi:Hypothetical protein NocV09_00203060 [Nannochloropsis oceanica]